MTECRRRDCGRSRLLILGGGSSQLCAGGELGQTMGDVAVWRYLLAVAVAVELKPGRE